MSSRYYSSKRFEDIEHALQTARLTQRPVAVVDMDAFDANSAALQKRAEGTPIRVASKSIRVTSLIPRAAAQCRGGVLTQQRC